MNVYLVEDVGNSPGKIYAVLAKEPDAERFADLLDSAGFAVAVVERQLWYGQPSVLGVNE